MTAVYAVALILIVVAAAGIVWSAIDTIRRDTGRSCLFGQCTKPAKWIGVSPSTLAHNETYPTYACDEHVIGLVRVRDLDGNYLAGETRVLADLETEEP